MSILIGLYLDVVAYVLCEVSLRNSCGGLPLFNRRRCIFIFGLSWVCNIMEAISRDFFVCNIVEWVIFSFSCGRWCKI